MDTRKSWGSKEKKESMDWSYILKGGFAGIIWQLLCYLFGIAFWSIPVWTNCLTWTEWKLNPRGTKTTVNFELFWQKCYDILHWKIASGCRRCAQWLGANNNMYCKYMNVAYSKTSMHAHTHTTKILQKKLMLTQANRCKYIKEGKNIHLVWSHRTWWSNPSCGLVHFPCMEWVCIISYSFFYGQCFSFCICCFG